MARCTQKNNRRACSFVSVLIGLAVSAGLALLAYCHYTSTRRFESEKTQYNLWSTDEPLRKRKHRYRYYKFIVYMMQKEKNKNISVSFNIISNN
jgi:hypothetical protein